jgi:hypothetical protein
MKICPNCHRECDEHNWYCPNCHQRLPSLNIKATGHASYGDLDAYNQRFKASVEDKEMIREKNHQTSGDDDFDCAQPYSYIKRENGDRN